MPSLPGSRGCQGSPRPSWGSGQSRGECSQGHAPTPQGIRRPGTRDRTARAGLRVLTEVCQQVSGAAEPGSPAQQGAFWLGSRFPHSAEPGIRDGAQRANRVSHHQPQDPGPTTDSERGHPARWGSSGNQGREAIHLLGGCLRNVQRQRPLRPRLPGSCKEAGQVIL